MQQLEAIKQSNDGRMEKSFSVNESPTTTSNRIKHKAT